MRGQLVSHPVIAGVTPPLVPPGGPLLDQSEAALYLHKSVRWMRRALSERTVPAIKVGKSVFVRRADLDALIGSGYRPAANGSAAPPGLVSVSPRASKRPQALSDPLEGPKPWPPLTPARNGAHPGSGPCTGSAPRPPPSC